MPQIAFLKDRFDLTPAEARLVAHLMTGESLRSCEKVLGIKYGTLRSQLKCVLVFWKTDIRAMNETNPPPPHASPMAPPGSSS